MYERPTGAVHGRGVPDLLGIEPLTRDLPGVLGEPRRDDLERDFQVALNDCPQHQPVDGDSLAEHSLSTTYPSR